MGRSFLNRYPSTLAVGIPSGLLQGREAARIQLRTFADAEGPEGIATRYAYGKVQLNNFLPKFVVFNHYEKNHKQLTNRPLI